MLPLRCPKMTDNASIDANGNSSLILPAPPASSLGTKTASVQVTAYRSYGSVLLNSAGWTRRAVLVVIMELSI